MSRDSEASGGVRPLGIPTVADRIAQMVVKQVLEPKLEPILDRDSYGYRPGKSAHQAIETCRQRCWRTSWVLDFDIKGFFDAGLLCILRPSVAPAEDPGGLLPGRHAQSSIFCFPVQVSRLRVSASNG